MKAIRSGRSGVSVVVKDWLFEDKDLGSEDKDKDMYLWLGLCELSFLLLEYSVEYLIKYSSTRQGK